MPNKIILLHIILIVAFSSLWGQREMERLDRGIIAIRQHDGNVFVSWRLLGTDAEDVTFNLYRTFGKKWIKLNVNPLTKSTCYVDSSADVTYNVIYAVKPVLKGKELDEQSLFTLQTSKSTHPYFPISIQPPPDADVMGESYSYSANDASVGDLDGDGQYEIILKWEPSNSKRPPQTGFTGTHILDAYKLNGTLLWRINLGLNVRAGAAYTQFMVYDLDGDGRAEVVCKTADGTIDGKGNIIGNAKADWRKLSPSTDRTYGKILDGPEYITVFDGLTGAARVSEIYVPDRYPLNGWGGIGGNGGNDDTGNRVDHFSACIAYLDGKKPSVVMVRGWYGRTVAVAWDWRDKKLIKRWVFDSAAPGLEKYSGQGNHNIAVADVDGDGKDEICVGAMIIDDNGKGLFSTSLRHGDALHLGDHDPARAGLEVFGIHENEAATVELGTPGSALYDAKTGEIIWSNNPGVDVGRGLAADIDPEYLGAECWGAPGGTRRVDTGEVIYKETPNSVNFAVWWDGDLLRELLNSTVVSKWNWNMKVTDTLLYAPDVVSNNGTKSTPCLSADIMGDWREEVIWRTKDNKELRIYTTTIPTTYRFVTLMHDPVYRLAIAWQNVAYNQPPHTSFYLGEGMRKPPRVSIKVIDSMKKNQN